MYRLNQKKHAVGMKQCRRAIREGRASLAYIARDGDERLTASLVSACKECNVEIVEVPTMAELGKACGINVGAMVAVILND